jgi:hypothetical protein
MPNSTFGQVLDEVRRRGALNENVLRLLRDLEIIRHNEFGHGNAQPFRLNAREVDFVYTSCASVYRVTDAKRNKNARIRSAWFKIRWFGATRLIARAGQVIDVIHASPTRAIPMPRPGSRPQGRAD